MKSSSFFPLGLALTGVLLLGMLTLAPQSAVAAPAALPTRPPTATPAGPTATPDPNSPTGGLIELRLPTAPTTAWTIVQWQDGLGGWHSVEGWQGNFDDGFSKVWWAAPKDLGTGPFRWVVYDKRDGKVWGTSPSFYLPATPGQRVVVDSVKK